MTQDDLFHDYAPRRALADPVGRTRRDKGKTSYLAGLAAEDIVARHYDRAGASEIARRWRGRGGEIDLICHDGRSYVFVEIKTSRSFEAAQAHYTRRQSERIVLAAQEFLGGREGGLLNPMRLDLALVDRTGAVRVIENAVWFD